jgi:hypothetical protein
MALRNRGTPADELRAGTLIPTTTNPRILCTQLPPHWRSNKALPEPFRLVSLDHIDDGTPVLLIALNEMGQESDVKNATATFQGGTAMFSDLRFVGKSGRGITWVLSR